MNVFDLFEYNDEDPENEGAEKLRFHLKKNRFKSLGKHKLHSGHHHGVDETASMTKGMKSNHEAFKMQEARKPDVNFDIEDIKRLEQIKDLATLKTQALALIAKPSAKPMKPEKVEWFRSALERMDSPMKVIKLMYDLMLSGEGHQVIGSRGSMNPNSYRSRFGEQDIKEVSNKLLDRYKKAAGADASAADKRGDIEHGNKRFKGIIKATIKQGENDAKKHKGRDVAEGSEDDIEDTRQFRNAIALAKSQKAIRQAKDGKDAKHYADGTKVTPDEVARRAAERKAKKQGVAEGSSGAKYKIKSIGKDKNGDYYISPNTGKKVYKQAKVGDHETPRGEVKPKVAEGNEPRFLDDDFYAYDPETKEIKGTWSHKSVGRRHSEYRAQQEGWKVVSGMRARSLGLHHPTRNESKQRLDPKCWTGYKKQGTKMKGGVRVNNCVPAESIEEENKGLYYNVNKRKKAGTSRPAGHPKAPTAQAWKDAAKTAKKNESIVSRQMMEALEEYLYELELAGYEIINEKRTRP